MAQGASFCVSEMVSAKALTMGDKKTPLLMANTPEEHPFGVQLFGYDPDTFAAAAIQVVSDFCPDFIDINMGCPTPKITGNGSGSALMNRPETAAAIVAAVCAVVEIPVTCKIRAGYDSTSAARLAPLLEKAGAACITVHGRTRDRMYRPPVDLNVIRDVKKSVSVPVIGNGDITTPENALTMLDYTGCDAVMVGRAALGNPFIFGQINAAISGKPLPALPSVQTRMDMLRTQVQLMCAYKGEFIALREARKHAGWYTKGLRGAATLRARSSALGTLEDLHQFIDLVLQSNPE
jgi:nifR3 family TIM-barrel protein